jgi:hypothetical protein
MDKMIFIIALGFLLFGCSFPEIGTSIPQKDEETDLALDLPRDNYGWTMFSPSSDTRIMYVSASGNDSTGAVYNSKSYSDPFSPSLPSSFKTYAAAFAHARNGYPDWILFKRGETFYEAIGSQIVNGRSASEPFLVGCYGNTGASPVLKIGSSTGIQIGYVNSSAVTSRYIAIQGIRVYSHTRDPNDTAEYVSGAGGCGISVFTYGSVNRASNILIEGCACMYNYATIYADGGSPWVQNVVFRRNVVYGNYAVGTEHAQGMWISHVNNLLLEENIFDHNGWLVQAYDNTALNGQATMFNHNIYTCAVTNTVYRKNLFMRASSMGTKFTAPDAASNTYYGGQDVKITGLVIDNNLYIDGEIGIGLTGNYPDNKYAAVDPVIENNVFYDIGKSGPTNRWLSWGMALSDIDGGSVQGNLLVNNLSLNNTYAIALSAENKGLSICNNVASYLGGTQEIFYIDQTAMLNDMEVANNYFERLGSTNFMVRSGSTLAGIKFNSDNYYSPSPPAFSVNNSAYNPSRWVSAFEPSARFSKRTLPDETRTVETYMASIGETATLDAFYTRCRLQDRYGWDTRFTADAVNAWIRNGFGLVSR